jgi:uncharacterized protein YegJ (DUF2314 family)
MRYHFHVIDGIDICDYRGTILADEYEARIYAKQMMAVVARASRTETNQKFIQVTDNDGAEIFRLAVPVKDAGATAMPAAAH